MNVQMIGTCPDTVSKVSPELPPNTERWMFNEPIRYPKTIRNTYTRWFDTHSNAHIAKRHPTFMDWAFQQDGARPIYTLEENLFPGHKIFPGREVIAALKDDYFTHQAAFVVAYAIWLEEVERIELLAFSFGVGGENNWKYAFERPCITYWVGRARQAGIEVITPPEAKLCNKKFLYGYEGPSLSGG